MTISTTTSTITYGGNGITTAWTFPFVADAASDLVVTLTSNTGVDSILSPSLYSVVLGAVPVGGLWAVGGTVNYPLVGSPIASGYKITITRAVPYTQAVSITNQGAFYPQVVEQGLDVLELQLQQLITSDNFSLKFPVSDGTLPNVLPGSSARANGYLAFDANGQPIVTTAPTYTNIGSSATPRKVSTTGTATINVLTTDSFSGVSIYQSSTPVTTIQLPATGGPYPIFDGGGNAASANITVLPPGGKTIDGASSYVMNTNFQSVTFYIDNTQVLIGSGSQGLGTNISVAGSISAGTTLSAGTTVTAGTGMTSTTGNIKATAGLIQDILGNVRKLPYVSKTVPYTPVTADIGSMLAITNTGANFTIPNSVFAAGDCIVVFNRSGGNVVIAEGAGVSLTWVGSGTSGSRTLANVGMATIICIGGADTWIITGVGIT